MPTPSHPGPCPLCEDNVLPLAEVKRRYVLVILKKHKGHRANTARALGVGLRTLGLWLQEWKQGGLIDGHA